MWDHSTHPMVTLILLIFTVLYQRPGGLLRPCTADRRGSSRQLWIHMQ